MLDSLWTGEQVLSFAVRLQALTSDLAHFGRTIESHEETIHRQGEELRRLAYAVHDARTVLRHLDERLSAPKPGPWWTDLHSLAPLGMLILAMIVLILKWTGHSSEASALSDTLKLTPTP
jgi:hypothetical protein